MYVMYVCTVVSIEDCPPTTYVCMYIHNMVAVILKLELNSPEQVIANSTKYVHLDQQLQVTV